MDMWLSQELHNYWKNITRCSLRKDGRMKQVLCALIMLFPMVSYGASVNLSDCAQASVVSAINNSSSGDTITCPAGNWSWSDVNITKNITLQGAGIGSTIISLSNLAALESPSSYTGAFRITGFTFKGTSGSANGDWDFGMVRIDNGHGFRIDHNEFQIYSNTCNGTGGNGIGVWHDSAGLIDHNRFVPGGGSGCIHYAVAYFNSGTTNTSNDATEYSWLNFDSNTVLRSADHTLFIEDNYFYNPTDTSPHGTHAGYGGFGGVTVFRHNEIHNMDFNAHGLESSHSAFAYEVSNNAWIQDVSHGLYRAIVLRGGTGVVYNNTKSGSGTINHGIELWCERASGNPGASNVDVYVPRYGTVRGNQLCPEGHPCAETIGRGQNQSSDPLYIWGNASIFSDIIKDGANSSISGSDYYLNSGAKPGYSSYTYPHLLQGGGGGPASIPNPPSGLSIN